MNDMMMMQYLIAKREIEHLKKLNLILQDYILLEKRAHIAEVIKLEERIRVLEGKEEDEWV